MHDYDDPKDLPNVQKIGQEVPGAGPQVLRLLRGGLCRVALTEREKALIALAVAHKDVR